MALTNLTGQNIQDTYQRLLQTDDGTLRDGTGSLVTSVGIGTTTPHEALHVVGDLKIQTNEHAGVIHFGNTSDETKIIGYDSSFLPADSRLDFYVNSSKNLSISHNGNVSASGDIITDNTGSFGRIICTSITASTGDFDANTIRIGGTSFSKSDLDTLKTGGSINTTSKNIRDGETSTNIVVSKAYISPSSDDTLIKMGNNVLGIFSERTILNGNVTASSNISASGDIYFNNISGGTF